MEEPTIVVGQVAKAHGILGEVVVRSRSDNPDRWIPGAVVSTSGGLTLTVTSVRPHAGRLLVRFAEIPDRNAADALHGAELTIPRSALPALGAGEWWPHELEGCSVRTEAGRDLGVVREVVFNPANDLWVTVSEDGTETLVPALRSLLIDVDVDARLIMVRDVPGLTAPDETDES